MSHTSGKVTFADRLVLHFEYDGNYDVCLPALYDTINEVMNNWRTHPERKCICGRSEPVEIQPNYGNDETWNGTACRHCKVITSGTNPNYLRRERHRGYFE